MSELQPIHIRAVEALPPNIRFGGSSWTYPGWKGLIYHREYKNDREFRAKSLEEYGRCPLFRSVGIDSAFYNPPSEELLVRYAGQIPTGFQWVEKVWERITIPKYPTHARYGDDRGRANPDFLNPGLFIDAVLAPHRLEVVQPHVGPFVFQFPTIRRDILERGEFLARLKDFLSALPPDFRYATEIRNPEFLVPEYFRILNESGVTHCFNHWHIMPPLIEQMKRAASAGGLHADFYVARILTPLGVSYEGAVKLFEPYDRIKRPNIEMRRDVVRLIKRAIERKVDAFIIINNRSEGNSPGTISAIAEMVEGGER